MPGCPESVKAACRDSGVTVSFRPAIAWATATAVVPVSRATVSPSVSSFTTVAARRSLACAPDMARIA